MLIEIKNVYGLVIYSSLNYDNIKDVVEEAIINKVSLYSADLKNVDLSNIDLQRVDLRYANLRNANLELTGLEGSDMSGADLTKSNLRNANLRNVNLMLADLEGADLTGVNLAGAHVDRLLGVNYAVCGFAGHGECGRTLLAIEINSEVILFCGCFKGTEQELRYYIEEGTAKFKDSRLLALETVLKLISIKKKY